MIIEVKLLITKLKKCFNIVNKIIIVNLFILLA